MTDSELSIVRESWKLIYVVNYCFVMALQFSFCIMRQLVN